MAGDYPHPEENTTNRPFLDAWREGRLALQHCSACQLTFFYPREMCPRCWSPELTWSEAAGHGVVVSYTLIHRPLHAAFEPDVPVVMAEITLDEGASLLGRVVGHQHLEIRSGDRVRLVPQDLAQSYPLPTFELA